MPTPGWGFHSVPVGSGWRVRRECVFTPRVSMTLHWLMIPRCWSRGVAASMVQRPSGMWAGACDRVRPQRFRGTFSSHPSPAFFPPGWVFHSVPVGLGWRARREYILDRGAGGNGRQITSSVSSAAVLAHAAKVLEGVGPRGRICSVSWRLRPCSRAALSRDLLVPSLPGCFPQGPRWGWQWLILGPVVIQWLSSG